MLSAILALGDRFDSKRGIDDSIDGDWRWAAACFSNGYGAFRVGDRQMRAHIIAYIQASGILIPEGLKVCHTCDCPSCTRSDGPRGEYVVRGIAYPRYGHLWLGTDKANHEDRNDKGRQAKGDRQGLRVHPERAPFGERNGSYTHPESVRRGDANHAHAHPELMSHGEDHLNAKLTAETVREARILRATGMWTYTELAARYGVNSGSVYKAVMRQTWKSVE